MATVNRDFVRAVLRGEKKLLKISEKRSVNVPKYDELSVKNIFPKFKRDAEVMQYLMDEYPANRLPDRDYFFTVLNTVHPEHVRKMIEHAQAQRFSAQGQRVAV